MNSRLTVRSDLQHDGDGIVRYHIRADSPDFRGSTSAWGNDSDCADLAKLLAGFPKSLSSSVEFTFGTPRTGRCLLRFEPADRTGKCCVWAEVESTYAAAGTERFETSSVCVHFLPAALDEFCTQLLRFKSGRDNEATLVGRAL